MLEQLKSPLGTPTRSPPCHAVSFRQVVSITLNVLDFFLMSPPILRPGARGAEVLKFFFFLQAELPYPG